MRPRWSTPEDGSGGGPRSKCSSTNRSCARTWDSRAGSCSVRTTRVVHTKVDSAFGDCAPKTWRWCSKANGPGRRSTSRDACRLAGDTLTPISRPAGAPGRPDFQHEVRGLALDSAWPLCLVGLIAPARRCGSAMREVPGVRRPKGPESAVGSDRPGDRKFQGRR